MTRLGNWWRYLCQRGPVATGQAITDRFIYRSHRFFVTCALLAGPRAADHVGDITLRLARPSDFDRLDELERYGRGSIQRTYVELDKDWLFVACHGDRIVATRRVSRVVRGGLESRVVQLNEGQVWAADIFCLPEYRNQGLGRYLALLGDRFLAALGFEERLAAVAVTNTFSLRMSRRVADRPLYDVCYLRILFWERLRVSTDIPKELWGGWSDQHADSAQ